MKWLSIKQLAITIKKNYDQIISEYDVIVFSIHHDQIISEYLFKYQRLYLNNYQIKYKIILK